MPALLIRCSILLPLLLAVTLPPAFEQRRRPSAPDTDARCSQVIVKPDSTATDINILKLRGTRDSLSDGRWYLGRQDVQRGPTDSFTPPFDVYGHVFNVRSFTGPDGAQMQGQRRVVLIWWNVTPGCSRYKPSRALRYADTNIVMSASLRKRDEWIGNLPTFDVPQATFVYVDGTSMFDR